MKISRQVGTTNEILNLFISDASVTTGAGLANVIGSSVSYAWWHNDQAAASTGTASTAGSMGIYSTSAWVQISSSAALGWYQFGAPNGVFASGRTAALYFNGAPSMAALPVEIELTKTDNQTYVSSQSFGNVLAQVSSNLYRIYSANAVTSASGTLITSTQTLSADANVTQILGSAAVTSAAGQLRVSTQALATTTNANVLQAYGSPIVTSDAGILNVSTQALTLLDASVSSRLAVASYVAPDNTGIANVSSAVINTMTESYRADGAGGTMPQLMYEIIAHLGESSISGVTKTINQIDGATPAATFTLDSSTAPTSITRTT